MPTVLRVGGFRVMIYPQGREHLPSHVHVFKAGTELVVTLGEGTEQPDIMRNLGMRGADLVAAYRLVQAHRDDLRAAWRKHHG